MPRKRPWSDFNTVPTETLPADLATAFKPAGYRCWTCGWTTDKVGYSGRQAARAHSRVHAYDTRAWRQPLIACIVLTGVLAVLGWLGEAGLLRSPSLGPPMPASLMLWTGVLAIVVALAASARTVWPGTQASPVLLVFLRLSVVVAVAPAALVTLSEIGIVQVETGVTDYVLAALAAVSAAWLAATAGWFRWLIRRRARSPGSYVELSEAKTFDAEVALEDRVRQQHSQTPKRKRG